MTQQQSTIEVRVLINRGGNHTLSQADCDLEAQAIFAGMPDAAARFDELMAGYRELEMMQSIERGEYLLTPAEQLAAEREADRWLQGEVL